MVLFPFELHIGPDILRLPFADHPIFAKAVIDIEFQRARIVEHNANGLMAMEERYFCGQLDIQQPGY